MSTLKPDQERNRKSRKGLKHDFDAVDLRIFLSIDEATTLNDVSAKLGISKQAISMRISQLEEIFGIQLIQHTPLRLTEAGRLFHKFAENDEEAKRKLALDMASLKSNDGFLRIVAISSILIDDANPVLAETQSEFIHLTASLIEGASARIIQLVRDGGADIGLIGKESKIEGLVFEKYRTTEAALLVHATHPLAIAKQIRLKDLEPYRVVSLPKTNLLDQRIVAAQMATGALIRSAHTAPDMEIASQFAANTHLGATIVLKDVARRYAQFYGAKIVNFSEPWRHFDLYTVTREIERRSEAMTFFINKLRQKYR